MLVFIISGISISLHAQSIRLDNNHNLTGIPFNGKLILTSDLDSTFWTSDGTAGGTKQLSPVRTGNYSYGIFNNKIYFNGLDKDHGGELWATNGTTAGTELVSDILPSMDSSNPNDFIVYLGKLYFTAYTPGIGRELYQYTGNGSPSAVTDINAGSPDSFDDPLYYLLNNTLFFNAKNSSGMALYNFNGFAATKIIDFPAGYSLSGYSYIDNTLFFFIQNGMNGMRIYKSNGISGATLVTSFSGALSGIAPPQIVAWNNKIFFTAAALGADFELWSTDGNITQMVKDINPGPNGSSPIILNSVILKNKLVFTASTDDSGAELWVTDGTEAGTNMLIDLNENPEEGSDPGLWPVMISYEEMGAGQMNEIFDRTKNYNGYIFFSANPGGIDQKLYKTDGTAQGTDLVKDIIVGDGNGNHYSFMYTKSGVLFSGNDGVGGSEPWISDGTSAGTKPISDINSGGDSNPEFLFIWNGDVYLNADNGDGGPDMLYDFYKLTGPYSPLPVTLSFFKATLENSAVMVQWQTTSESNSEKFELLRSDDGNHFTKIGEVAAAGNSNITLNYSYVDRNAFQQNKEVFYYRIAIVDKDGKRSFSPVEKVKISQQSVLLKLYPNPAHQTLHVYHGDGFTMLEVVDANGRMLIRKQIDGSAAGPIQLDIASLPAGTYVLKAFGAQPATATFIKR